MEIGNHHRASVLRPGHVVRFQQPVPGSRRLLYRQSAVGDLSDEAPDIGLHVLRLRMTLPQHGDHLLDARVGECSPDLGGRPREQAQALAVEHEVGAVDLELLQA